MYYVTVEELKALMPSLFTSKQLTDVGWGDYTTEDLGAILGQAEGFIDGLRYKGQYVEEYQQHAFPRKLNTGYVVNKEDERLKKAVCCVLYDLLKSSISDRYELISQGVKSISTGGVSESYGEKSEISKVSDDYVKYLGFCIFQGIL